MIDLEEIDFPVVKYGDRHIFVSRNISHFTQIYKPEFNRIRSICLSGKMRLLTSKGDLYNVTDMISMESSNLIIRLGTRFRAKSVISFRKNVDIEEFIKRVRFALRMRQIGDYDSDFIARFEANLRPDPNYRDIIEAIPRTV